MHFVTFPSSVLNSWTKTLTPSLNSEHIHVDCREREREREREGKGLTTALKRVDLPTLGRPTMPALRLMLILEAEEENRRR